MHPQLAYSPGLVVCEHHMLDAMREIQAAEDAGRACHAYGGGATAILSMSPAATKWATCDFCPYCDLVVVIATRDQIPPEDLPPIAKE
jgi:hypothetical protein